IVVAPLPLLGRKRATAVGLAERCILEKKAGGEPFLFYPTANRPNKKIAFLLRLLAHVRLARPKLRLVLTCNLDDYPAARAAAQNFDLMDHISFLPGASESALRWLYESAAAVCLTSVVEGNFPPQILEAMNYDAPVVATRLPTITEILGEDSSRLL